MALDPRTSLTVLPVTGVGEIEPGDDLAAVLAAAVGPGGDGVPALLDGDVVVVTQKIVSKAEGRIVPLDPGDPEAKIAPGRARVGPRPAPPGRAADHRDRLTVSSAPTPASTCRTSPTARAALLPVDSDRSARRLRAGLRRALGVDVGVIVSDTFGRPWRQGVTDVAIGCAGVAAVVDLRGTVDALGRQLVATEVCVADEIAAAAELVMGKDRGVPAAVVRGVPTAWRRDGSVADEVIRRAAEDLFR